MQKCNQSEFFIANFGSCFLLLLLANISFIRYICPLIIWLYRMFKSKVLYYKLGPCTKKRIPN